MTGKTIRAFNGQSSKPTPLPPETPPPLTGRDVHREWRDGMLAQGRHVAPERLRWETLSEEDRLLDDGIAERLAALAITGPATEQLREAAQDVVDRWLTPSLGHAMTFDTTVKNLARALAALPSPDKENQSGHTLNPDHVEADAILGADQ